MDVIASSATHDFHVSRLPESKVVGCDSNHVSAHFQISHDNRALTLTVEIPFNEHGRPRIIALTWDASI
jgi:hypothetical protein